MSSLPSRRRVAPRGSLFASITRARRRGGAAIEFGMWLPVLVLLVGAMLDFGMYMSRVQTVNRAARDAARTSASVVVSPDATLEEIELDVAPVARAVAAEILRSEGLACNNCAQAVVNELEPTRDTTLRVVDVMVTQPFDPFFGFTPFATEVTGRFVLALDRQRVDLES